MDERTAADMLVERALSMHARNFNCAQCVACALAPLVEASEDASFRMMEGFGAGMGGLTETCGAISGAVAILGQASSNGAADPTSKASTYKLVRRCVGEFREKNGATLCADLKGVKTKQPLRSCDGCIEDATRIAAAILFEQQKAAAAQ